MTWIREHKKTVGAVVTAVAVGIAYAIGGMPMVNEVLRVLGGLGLAPATE